MAEQTVGAQGAPGTADQVTRCQGDKVQRPETATALGNLPVGGPGRSSDEPPPAVARHSALHTQDPVIQTSCFSHAGRIKAADGTVYEFGVDLASGPDRTAESPAVPVPPSAGLSFRPTPTDWLPGQSTLLRLVEAAIAAGFTHVSDPVDRQFVPIEGAYLMEVRAGHEHDVITTWDAAIIDHGLLQVSGLDDQSDPPAFDPVLLLATAEHMDPVGQWTSWVPQTATADDLLIAAVRAGYTHIWIDEHVMRGWRRITDGPFVCVDMFSDHRPNAVFDWVGLLEHPGCLRIARRSGQTVDGHWHLATAEHVQARRRPE